MNKKHLKKKKEQKVKDCQWVRMWLYICNWRVCLSGIWKTKHGVISTPESEGITLPVIHSIDPVGRYFALCVLLLMIKDLKWNLTAVFILISTLNSIINSFDTCQNNLYNHSSTYVILHIIIILSFPLKCLTNEEQKSSSWCAN